MPLPCGSPSDEELAIAREWLHAVGINPDRAQGGQYGLASLLAGHRARADSARRILSGLMNAPHMFAATREALMRVTTVCEMVLPPFDPLEFSTKHMREYVKEPADMREKLGEDFTDDWARSVVYDAIGLLPKTPR